MAIYDRIFKPRTLVLSDGKKVYEKRSRAPLIVLALIISTYISVRITGFNFTTLMRRGNQFWVILAKMFPPDLSYAGSIWSPLFDTIKMSLIGSVAGALAAVPFAVLSSSNIVKNRVVIIIFRLLFSLLRTLPTPCYCAHRDFHIRTGHHSRNCCHSSLHIRICREAFIRADRDDGDGEL